MKIILSLLFIVVFNCSALFGQHPQWTVTSRCDPHYTFEALDNNIEGRIILSFKVTRNGKVIPDSTRIIKPLGYGLEGIAIATLHKMPGLPIGKVQTDINKRYVLPILFTKNSISSCERSDYYVYKGKQAENQNNLTEAHDYFKKATDLDRSNSLAIKHWCLASFKLGKDLQKAEKAWGKLYAKKYISEEEFQNKN